MKKTLVLLLALVLTLSFCAILSSCDLINENSSLEDDIPNGSENNPSAPAAPVYTVTREEWHNATALNFTRYQITTTGMEGETTILTRCDDRVWSRTMYDDGRIEDIYYAKVDGKYYLYTAESGIATRTEITQEIYEKVLANDVSILFDYDDFTYNEETKSYYAPTMNAASTSWVTYTDATIKFLNGKIIYNAYTATTPSHGITLRSINNFTYDNIQPIELPTDFIEY